MLLQSVTMKKKIAPIYILVCLTSASSHALGFLQLAPLWATPVHNLMLETTFPQENWQCIVQMMAGSRHADEAQFQTGTYSYMHAMRQKGQTVATAAAQMWKYVDQKYAEIRLLNSESRREDACFLRGMALHPIMDSTSPAHSHFHEWDPIRLSDLLAPATLAGKLRELSRHGDVQSFIDRIVALPFQLSDEDMHVIDDHPEYLRITSDLMRAVEAVEQL